jgi:hypothetical protein
MREPKKSRALFWSATAGRRLRNRKRSTAGPGEACLARENCNEPFGVLAGTTLLDLEETRFPVVLDLIIGLLLLSLGNSTPGEILTIQVMLERFPILLLPT